MHTAQAGRARKGITETHQLSFVDTEIVRREE